VIAKSNKALIVCPCLWTLNVTILSVA